MLRFTRKATKKSKNNPMKNPHCWIAKGMPMMPAPIMEFTKLKLAPSTPLLPVTPVEDKARLWSASVSVSFKLRGTILFTTGKVRRDATDFI